MEKVTRVSNIISMSDRKPKKHKKNDFKRFMNKGPEPPKPA